jgi:hypothetical protein
VIDSAALSRTDSNEMPTAESASVPPNISITWARHGSRGARAEARLRATRGSHGMDGSS